jgi:hypothetical protein
MYAAADFHQQNIFTAFVKEARDPQQGPAQRRDDGLPARTEVRGAERLSTRNGAPAAVESPS